MGYEGHINARYISVVLYIMLNGFDRMHQGNFCVRSMLKNTGSIQGCRKQSKVTRATLEPTQLTRRWCAPSSSHWVDVGRITISISITKFAGPCQIFAIGPSPLTSALTLVLA